MILDWFNAQAAVEIGARLADDLPPKIPSASGGVRCAKRSTGTSPEKMLRQAASTIRPLNLNLFKRAKLLNSFKWKLLERGYERHEADEITQLLVMQLSPSWSKAAGPPAASAPQSAGGGSAQAIPKLIAEADALFARGKRDETVARLRQAIRLNPDHAGAHARLGAALCYLGQYEEAERELRRAAELDARCAEAHFNLGALLYYKGEFAASETTLRRAAKLDPRNAEALVSLGLTLGALSRLRDAKSCFAKALVVKPRNASALCGLGWLAAIEGRSQDCEKLYQDALEADPTKAHAWASLAAMRRMTSGDRDWLENVKRLIKAGVPPLDEAALRFAMGKYFDDLGEFAEAFAQYKRANELQKLIAKPYDRKARSALVDQVIRTHVPDRMRQRVEGASQSMRPVFVVGMMRSGTSLVEQIVASHPRAAGAGELDFWSQAARKHDAVMRDGVPDKALTKKLAHLYLERLAGHSRDALRVVDKSTFNSDHLGLIHSVFPDARIIYVRRDPVDTALSCYFQYFANAANFTMDLSDLAHYYREHHRLIQHWRSVLPRTTFLEVPYAELVADPEAWSRRMIEFIGLEWDLRCLEYYKTERPVLTASNWQVRERIYSRSLGRWRNYEKYIRPLLELREVESA